METESCLVEREGPMRLWDACLGKKVGSGRSIAKRGNYPVERVRCERLALDTGE